MDLTVESLNKGRGLCPKLILGHLSRLIIKETMRVAVPGDCPDDELEVLFHGTVVKVVLVGMI